MTLRNAVLGLAVVFGVSVWSACRSGGPQAHARTADEVAAAGTDGTGNGGTHDEAARRYRDSQSTHWRQVAIGR